ncbi:MAG: nitrogenase component 1, partial [Rhodospirillaceae bacterium]
KLGIRVRACITGDARYQDVAAAHTAKVNMMVCSQALINIARKMNERWGQPYFEGSFYGIADTSHALREIARLLVETGADASLIERTEALIAEEEAKAWAAMEVYKPRLTGKKVLLYTGGVKSWSVVNALLEMGMDVVGTSVRKSTEGDKERAQQALQKTRGKVGELFGGITAPKMYDMFIKGEADIMLSGGRSQFTALKARTAWMDINQERHHAYMGYSGMVTLVREMDREINNPVWAELHRPAPWEEGFAPDWSEIGGSDTQANVQPSAAISAAE